MLGGHLSEAGQRTDTYSGSTVHTVVSDYQTRAGNGNGYMRIMEFSPSANEIRVKTYSPHLGVFDTGSSHQFTLPYDMGGSGFAVLGTQTGVTSGSTTTIEWPALDPSTAYEWYVTVGDGQATTTGPTWAFTTAPAAPTTYTLTAPTPAPTVGYIYDNNGYGISCGSQNRTACTATFAASASTVVSLAGSPYADYSFDAWTGACASVGGGNYLGGTCSVTMDADKPSAPPSSPRSCSPYRHRRAVTSSTRTDSASSCGLRRAGPRAPSDSMSPRH